MFENAELIAILSMVYLVAGFVKGVMGFGLPIITMSLLPFFVSIETAIVLSAVVQPATNVFQFYQAGLWREAFKKALPVLLALLPGVLVGGWLLSVVNSSALLILAGITIVCHSTYQLVGAKYIIQQRSVFSAGLGIGLVAGIVGTLTSLNGWAFIIYLAAMDVKRNVFRSTIALLFLVSGSLISGAFWINGLLDSELFLVGGLMLIPAFFGMWAGEMFGKQLSNEKFRLLVLVSLVLIGGVIIYRGFQ